MEIEIDTRGSSGSSEEELVSIIITVYNQAHFLKKSIESALIQNGNIEIIVINDGSTDDSELVASKYPQVMLISIPNQGVSVARNVGFQASHGDYIVFLDADDVLLPGAIDANLCHLQKNPEAGLCYGSYITIDEIGNILKEIKLRTMHDPSINLFFGNAIGMHAAALYRRSALETAGLFDATLRFCEDLDMFLRVSQFFIIVCTDRPVAGYRKHKNNASRSNSLLLSSALKIIGNRGREFKVKKFIIRRAKKSWKEFYSYKVAHEIKNRNFKEIYKDKILSRDFLFMFIIAPKYYLRALIFKIPDWFVNR